MFAVFVSFSSLQTFYFFLIGWIKIKSESSKKRKRTRKKRSGLTKKSVKFICVLVRLMVGCLQCLHKNASLASGTRVGSATIFSCAGNNEKETISSRFLLCVFFENLLFLCKPYQDWCFLNLGEFWVYSLCSSYFGFSQRGHRLPVMWPGHVGSDWKMRATTKRCMLLGTIISPAIQLKF